MFLGNRARHRRVLVAAVSGGVTTTAVSSGPLGIMVVMSDGGGPRLAIFLAFLAAAAVLGLSAGFVVAG